MCMFLLSEVQMPVSVRLWALRQRMVSCLIGILLVIVCSTVCVWLGALMLTALLSETLR